MGQQAWTEHVRDGAGALPKGDPARLVQEHLHLVVRVVRKLALRFPRHVERDELHAAGASGLVEAAHRYDPATGVPFARFAILRIRGAVLDATRTRDWATRRMRRDLRAIESTMEQLRARLNRQPVDDEIAEELGTEPRFVRERRAWALRSAVLALERPAESGDDEPAPLAERIREHDPSWLPEEAAERSELVGTLRNAVAALPPVPRRVLIEHHFDGRRLHEVAADLGVTEARASQLRHEALHALRAYFGTVFDGVPDVPDDAPGKRRRASFVAQMAATGAPSTGGRPRAGLSRASRPAGESNQPASLLTHGSAETCIGRNLAWS